MPMGAYHAHELKRSKYKENKGIKKKEVMVD
jgi:hypothetical protein